MAQAIQPEASTRTEAMVQSVSINSKVESFTQSGKEALRSILGKWPIHFQGREDQLDARTTALGTARLFTIEVKLDCLFTDGAAPVSVHTNCADSTQLVCSVNRNLFQANAGRFPERCQPSGKPCG